MLTLSQAANIPQPVILAGEPYRAAALTLRDWAALNGWLLERFPRPKVTGPAADGEAGEVDRFLSRLAASWPPRVAGPDWFTLMELVEGGERELLCTALRPCHPRFIAGQAEGLIVRGISRDEWTKFIKVCLYCDPLYSAIAPIRKTKAAPGRDDWSDAAYVLAARLGYTIDQFLGLTFPQLDSLSDSIAKGSGRTNGRPSTDPVQAREMLAAVKAGMYK